MTNKNPKHIVILEKVLKLKHRKKSYVLIFFMCLIIQNFRVKTQKKLKSQVNLTFSASNIRDFLFNILTAIWSNCYTLFFCLLQVNLKNIGGIYFVANPSQ